MHAGLAGLAVPSGARAGLTGLVQGVLPGMARLFAPGVRVAAGLAGGGVR